MSQEKTRLVGVDGKLVRVTYGDTESGESVPNDGWYEITAKAESSELPDAANVGDLIYLEEDDTLAADDEVTSLELTDHCDVTEFSFDIDKSEIDVTTLCDNVRRYRGGKTDMSGSLNGITTLGLTDEDGWVINQFLRVVRQQADGNGGIDYEVSEIDDSPIYLMGVVKEGIKPGEREAFVWARVTMLGSELGASGEDAQSFSSEFRIAPGDPEPTFYIRTIPEES